MKVTRVPHHEDKLLRQMWTSMQREPSPAPSVTQLIRCLTRTYYERNMLPQMPARKVLMFFVTGLALEKALLVDSQIPTAGVTDGISWHTDHVEVGGDFYEIKSTRTSSAKGFESLSKTWHKQFLAYLKATNRQVGHFVILHLMGDYRPPFPDLVVYEVEATTDEIEDNWKWLQQRKATLEDFEARKQPPTQFSNRIVDWGGSDKDYECEDCPFLPMCNLREEGLLN